MIKVLIVEDKPPILWSIKQKVLQFSADISVIGEAFNGTEALEIINKNTPDIIITDIRMPVMDGLSLIKAVNTMNIDCKFIIISGHDEFEYARQAIKLGAADYLLKPVSQESVNNILETLTREIKKKQNEHQQNLINNILLKDINLSTVNNHFCEYDHYYLLMICGGSYSPEHLNFSHPHNFFLNEKELHNVIKENFDEDFFSWSINTSKLNEIVHIIGVPKHKTLDLNFVLNATQNTIKKSNYQTTIIISDSFYNIGEIYLTVSNLRKTLKRNIIFGFSSIFKSKDLLNTHTQISDALSSFENSIALAINSHNKNLFINQLSLLLKQSEQLKCPQLILEKILNRIVEKITITYPDLIPDECHLDIQEMIIFNDDYDNLFKSLSSYFSFIVNNDNLDEINKPIFTIVQQTETYLKNHYSEEITINDIAKIFSVDPCYLSKSFKHYKQVSPMQFLTNTRIETAKSLLTKSKDIKLKDIAIMVGYSNQYYFSRIFKSVTNQSPSKYRDTNSNAN